MGLSRTVSEGDFANSSHPRVFCAPSEFRRLELGIGAGWGGGQKTWMMVRPGREKFDDIFSRLVTIHQRDGRTDTGQRPHLRIASRGIWGGDSRTKSKCLPILLYGLECCNLRSADLHSLDFTYNRLFMKPVRTKSIDVVSQYFFCAVLPNVLVLRKANKLALRIRYKCLENAFCT